MREPVSYVGFLPRLVAALVDTVVLAATTIPALVTIYGFRYLEEEPHGFYGPADIFFSLIFPIGFSVLFWRYSKATPGKMLVKAEVVDQKTGGAMTVHQSLVRYFASLLSVACLGVGVLWICFDARRQGWHDKIAGTVVVKKGRS